MNAAEAFERVRAQMEAQIGRAGTMDEAVAAGTMALEQTACLLMQQEQDELTRQRQQAVLAVARCAPRLLRAACARGELVVRDEATKPGRLATAGAAIAGAAFAGGPIAGAAIAGAAIAGGAVLAVLAGYMLLDGHPLLAALQLAGMALLGLRGSGARCEARGVCSLEAKAAARCLAELCQAVDVCTADLALLERDTTRVAGTADEATIDLLGALMEAKASGRADVALRSLDQAEQYLHLLGVEIVPYDEEHAALFDRLPTLGEPRTIRPALLREGRLVRRGMAACRMEVCV